MSERRFQSVISKRDAIVEQSESQLPIDLGGVHVERERLSRLRKHKERDILKLMDEQGIERDEKIAYLLSLDWHSQQLHAYASELDYDVRDLVGLSDEDLWEHDGAVHRAWYDFETANDLLYGREDGKVNPTTGELRGFERKHATRQTREQLRRKLNKLIISQEYSENGGQ
jgi:hypothetical protein